MEQKNILSGQIIDIARRMSASGLSPGRSGNVSARYRDGFLITPTGMSYDALSVDDIVFVTPDGHVPMGQRRPSSEWRFHGDIYSRFAEAGAVVHCHSRYATALACAGRPIPAFHYMVAAAGGSSIPLASYALFGSQELSDNVVVALEQSRAILMEFHGQIAYGKDLEAASALAEEVEELAAQYVLTLSLGSDRVLDDNQMQDVLELFKTYGDQSPPEGS
jgi:L-fuculose-phosphate aldolase